MSREDECGYRLHEQTDDRFPSFRLQHYPQWVVWLPMVVLDDA